MSASAVSPSDFTAFLHAQLQQPGSLIAHHDWQGQSLWLKRAGRPHPAWSYRLLALVVRWLGVPALAPVPNPGGQAAIATEVQRLRSLAASGVRVPQVLAACAEGFVMQDVGGSGTSHNLGRSLERAPDGATALALWQQGLAAISDVHARGQCLSQAFARNMVLCSDGCIGFIDFEDDPAAHLPLVLCQLRDALCYAHSTAWILDRAQVLPQAQALWQDWAATWPVAQQQALAQAQQQLGLLGRLPRTRRWGRDTQRLRLAWQLLASHER